MTQRIHFNNPERRDPMVCGDIPKWAFANRHITRSSLRWTTNLKRVTCIKCVQEAIMLQEEITESAQKELTETAFKLRKIQSMLLDQGHKQKVLGDKHNALRRARLRGRKRGVVLPVLETAKDAKPVFHID